MRINLQIYQHLEILLNDVQTRFSATITQQSGDRLQLTPSNEVLVFGATWVKLSVALQQTRTTQNALAGVVTGQGATQLLLVSHHTQNVPAVHCTSLVLHA